MAIPIPINIPTYAVITFTAESAGVADTLYSGSLSALTDYGFIVSRTIGISTTTWIIAAPTDPDAYAENVTVANAFDALDTEIIHTIQPALRADYITEGQTPNDATDSSSGTVGSSDTAGSQTE